MFKITQTITRYSIPTCTQQFLWLNKLSSAPISAALRNTEQDNETILHSKKQNKSEPSLVRKKDYNGLVAAAFASLKDEKNKNLKGSFPEIQFSEATTVSELLSIANDNGTSRKHALKVISLLAEWSSSGKVELSDFDTDPRFIKLCKILTKRSNLRKSLIGPRNEDLSTIINVTADDEAAKLITSISLTQAVKVMSTLAQKKRRSTQLLRSLAYNIAGNTDHLDLKQCSDLLYSSAMLNFIDENMLEKVCSDICMTIYENVKGTAVTGSILTSLGHLRYKDGGILDILSDWIVKNNKNCRLQDICSLFITLGSLNYTPSNMEQVIEVLLPQLKDSEITKPTTWLDVVWSLIVLNIAKPEHLSSVLSENFVTKINHEDNASIPSKLKLLNIDSASKLLINNYNGPYLPENSDIRNTVISRTKDKLIMVNALQDTISNLLNPKTHLRTNVCTDMGFCIDAELLLDKKCNPLPINTPNNNVDTIKLAVVALDFHDTCRGRVEPNGYNVLYFKLLEAKGYRILPILYIDFNSKDKLVNRVKYFESALKRSVLH